MKRGLTVPIFNDLADPSALADLAAEAEACGWDGFFLWDHIYYRHPVVEITDPWIALAVIALRTERMTLGPMVTPLARRRPHVVARQVAALDQVSGGRIVLGTGLGLDSSGGEFERFGEEANVALRARRYDEALQLVRRLLSGERVDFKGNFVQARDVVFQPAPAREIPIWVAARWPNIRPIKRAAQYDGLFIIDIGQSELSRAAEIVHRESEARDRPFDLIVHSLLPTTSDDWESNGATWWLAAFDPYTATRASVRESIRRGPY